MAQSVARYEPAGTPEAGTKTDRHFKLVHASAIEARPPRWVVRDILEAEALALVFGDPGTCKSFWAMDIGLSVATGTDFHGHVIADHGPVVYVCGEGQNGIKRRLMAWSALRGVSHDSAPFFVSMSPTALVDPDALDEVLKAIDDIAASAGPPRVVIFDTLARNFGPADENSTSDMSKAISAADAIRARYRSTVLLVHHSGHADKTRARGAMSLKAALDSEYRLDKDETGTIRFEATKMKDAEHPEPMAFRLRPVDLDLIDPDTGEIITGAALELTSYEPRAAKGKQGRGKWQTRANEVLMNIWSTRQDREGEAARISLADWKDALKDEDFPRQRIAEVTRALIEAQAVHEAHGFVSPVF
ncbi:MAG: hypothetical protein A2V21_303310 [Deltaproteobacteria bacterium GWC2_55_46]|nr:MAG: hypothetical protein A2Z79_12240 [Deltaproteobacteria bacterium GWA2_55_82]OGQ64016.1 MAG: hypothetical protein A3I81_07770 [Deltaproteobacteria bacterium RIFCSPLOWO2_02_FULL_55_12]OIJ75033.1 MAG: hypothetical protein A2V21_303310 [Deltaproteobacteria bacterium GWC2_55_46]